MKINVNRRMNISWKICAAHFQGASENGRKMGQPFDGKLKQQTRQDGCLLPLSGEWRMFSKLPSMSRIYEYTALAIPVYHRLGRAPMLTRSLSLLTAVLAVGVYAGNLRAQQSPAALSGIVSSAKDGAMEGVVVSAKKTGSIVTVSVATDDKGRFSFPATRLEPGKYELSTRAVGYDLEGPKSAEILAGKTASVEIKLAPTKI